MSKTEIHLFHTRHTFRMDKMFHRDNKHNIYVKIYLKYSMIHRDNQHNGETAVLLLLVHAVSFCNREP